MNLNATRASPLSLMSFRYAARRYSLSVGRVPPPYRSAGALVNAKQRAVLSLCYPSWPKT